VKEATLTTTRPILAVLLAAALGACAITEVPPSDHFYRLDVPEPTARFDRAPLSGVLEVARFGADGLVGDRAVAYVVADQPHEIFDYNYHFWNQAPGEMVQDQLIRFLRSANVADRVLSPDLRIPADYVVEGRIRRFEQSFADGVAMVVELELGLVRIADQRLLLLKSYRATQPAAGDSVAEAATAADMALAAIFTEFAADLARLKVGT
jgi:cholesterol transport system auxiliary component